VVILLRKWAAPLKNTSITPRTNRKASVGMKNNVDSTESEATPPTYCPIRAERLAAARSRADLAHDWLRRALDASADGPEAVALAARRALDVLDAIDVTLCSETPCRYHCEGRDEIGRCALEVARMGAHTLEEVGYVVGWTKEAVRLAEVRAMTSCAKRAIGGMDSHSDIARCGMRPRADAARAYAARQCDSHRRFEERRIADGKCVRCGAKCDARVCGACAEVHAAESRQRRAARIARGLCARCGAHPAREGRKTCDGCSGRVT
jgi:hypothetical protein